MPATARALATTAVAIVLVGGGFVAGRMTAPAADSTTSDCAEPRKSYRQYADTFSTDQEIEQKQINGRMLANTILQNPRCFSTGDRAAAQTILDTIEQGVQQDALNDLKECVADATDDYAWSRC